jgi:hypothetical protein
MAAAQQSGQSDRHHHRNDEDRGSGRRGGNEGDNPRTFYGGRGVPDRRDGDGGGQDPRRFERERGGNGYTPQYFQNGRNNTSADGRRDDRGQDNRGQDTRGQDSRQELRPLREVLATVRQRYGGDLISARREDGPRPFYVLRWRMANNEVRDIQIDAATGQVR